jgi:hypothetical protein
MSNCKDQPMDAVTKHRLLVGKGTATFSAPRGVVPLINYRVVGLASGISGRKSTFLGFPPHFPARLYLSGRDAVCSQARPNSTFRFLIRINQKSATFAGINQGRCDTTSNRIIIILTL